jgi:hypothetical protein
LIVLSAFTAIYQPISSILQPGSFHTSFSIFTHSFDRITPPFGALQGTCVSFHARATGMVDVPQSRALGAQVWGYS